MSDNIPIENHLRHLVCEDDHPRQPPLCFSNTQYWRYCIHGDFSRALQRIVETMDDYHATSEALFENRKLLETARARHATLMMQLEVSQENETRRMLEMQRLEEEKREFEQNCITLQDTLAAVQQGCEMRTYRYKRKLQDISAALIDTDEEDSTPPAKQSVPTQTSLLDTAVLVSDASEAEDNDASDDDDSSSSSDSSDSSMVDLICHPNMQSSGSELSDLSTVTNPVMSEQSVSTCSSAGPVLADWTKYIDVVN